MTATLTVSRVESLFGRGAPNLYPSLRSELVGTARGDKSNCNAHFKTSDKSGLRAFIASATALGLVTTQRTRRRGDLEAVEIVATKPGEEWRAEIYAWVLTAGSSLPKSESLTYFRSRALGYTHGQATQWVDMCRHRSPRHLQPAIYLFLPFAEAKQIHAGGRLTVREPFLVAATLGYEFTVLRRDALKRIPEGFAIGRAAFKPFEGLFDVEPYRTPVALCTASHRARLTESLLSPIDFWTGKRWSPKPRSS